MAQLPGPSVQARALALFLSGTIRPIGDRIRLHGLHLRVIREAFDALGYLPLPRGTRVRPVTESHGYGEVKGVWIQARDADETAGAILYLHGGGFVFGSVRTHRHLAAALSAASGLPVLLLDYRRAPEHPFPAAADDAVAGYHWLLDQGFPASRIVVAGDSAGGHLSVGLLADLTRLRLPMPGAAALFSPFLDLRCPQLDDRDATRRDPFVPPARARDAAAAYAGTTDLADPRLTVLKGSKRRWPPMLVQVGDTECLLGDSERIATAMRMAGAHCELQVWPGQVHVFPAFYPIVPEGAHAIRLAGEFLRTALTETMAA